MEPTLNHDSKWMGVGPSPFIAVQVDRDKVAEISGKRLRFYDIDGQTLFEVKDKQGNPTGDYVFFVIFE